MSFIISLALLSLLNPLVSAIPTTALSNNPSNPNFMASANMSFLVWARSECNENVLGNDYIYFDDLSYGKNYHALVVSFQAIRDMQADEQLDFSFFKDAQGSTVGGVDKECAAFQYTASPDPLNKALIKGGVCYTPQVPVTCFNFWKSS